MNRVKKRNFTESELEILLHEVEMRKHMLFGTLSTGINAKQKTNEWERVCEAVNAVGSQQRTHSEIKKKWSDLKVEVKRRVSAHRRSVTATGGGTGVGELSPFDLRVAALIGDTALTGVVGAHEGDTDHPQGKYAEFINAVIILVIQLAAYNTQRKNNTMNECRSAPRATFLTLRPLLLT